jgi:uncharacterized protein (DUF4415 family)
MKKTVTPKNAVRDELRPEYRFDYQKAKANRFADQTEEDRVVVVLDPDVAEVFRTQDSVNEVLRALIKTMPSATKRKAGSAQNR